jgi:hypothetical protein
MKCPSCAATLGALDRVCEYCGAQIPAQVIGSIAAYSAATSSVQATAAEISDKIQEDLAALARVPPASSVKAIVLGLLTPPTLGIAYLIARVVEVFGRKGYPPNRLILSIDENLRKGKTAYKHDPQVISALNKADAELAAYHSRSRSSRSLFLAACLVSIVLIAAIVTVRFISAKHAMERRTEVARLILSEVETGDIEAAMNALSRLSETGRQMMVMNQSLMQIPLAALNGDDVGALELTKGLADPICRAKAQNFIGNRLVETRLKAADYRGALSAATVLSPTEKRVRAEDAIREQQASALIQANQMDAAKGVIANITDEGIRASLAAQIAAKLPKAELNGF